MNSRIYVGEVAHARHVPEQHAFTYPIYFYVFDLDELPALDQQVRGFGYNRFSLVSLRDSDYLQGPGAIRQRLMAYLKRRGCDDDIARIELVTLARFLNYVFVPVSFYYAYRADGSLRCAVAEVNNTFDERHVYILDQPLSPPGEYPVRFRHAKEFHVSPFNNMEGEYEFSLSRLGDDAGITVDLFRNGAKIVSTRLAGKALPLTSENLRKVALKHPLTAALNLPRIVWQAGKLYFRKKLPVFKKPHPSSPMTMGAPPTWLEKISFEVIKNFLARMQRGTLRLCLPDRSTCRFGGIEPGRESTVDVRSWGMFWRFLRDGDVGFGESYTDGDWECDDLTNLLKLFVDNADILNDRDVRFSWVGRAINRVRHEWRRNTRIGSRRNIHEHYDLGNDFYSLFLGESMMYSAALYRKPDETLEQAQKNKLQELIRKARLQPGDQVLEIGCGWGSFAIEAARTVGCRVTGITISEEQLAFARERVRQAGVEDKVKIGLCDYRDVQGKYDKIVSIEMLEAVGHEYFGAFFRLCDRVLKPNGLVVLQVITIPDQRYNAYRRSTDWIQKHIFPGGLLPSLTALTRAMTRQSNLFIESLENIGPHYAPTLRTWRERFEAQRGKLIDMGFDETFIRKWRYYFCYCEAGFATRTTNDLHLVLTRAANRNLPGEPPVAPAP